MRFKTRLISVVFTMIALYSVLIDCAYSELSPIKQRELEKAYMNGFVNALKLDIEDLERLKKDLNILKEEVIVSAQTYMVIVEEMNKPKRTIRQGPKGNKRDYRETY